MTGLNPSVVLSHPGKHYHAYEIALAAQERGMLAKFLAGIYYKPGSLPYSLIEALPNRVTASWMEQLRTKRTMTGLKPELVLSMPYFELARKSWGKLPLAWEIVSETATVLLNNTLFDWWVSKAIRREQCNVLHAFVACAWRSFEQAKRMNLITVLDMPSNPVTQQYVNGEYGRPQSAEASISCRDKTEIGLADYVFAPSDFVIDDLVALGFSRERIFKIPWGVDTELFTPGPVKSDAEFQIVFVGNVGLRKGFHYLLEAVRQLQLPGLHLTIIGQPVDKLSEQMLHRYDGLCSWIPRVPYRELPNWYRSSDLLVFPSLAEGSAMVTYEAMACGLPAVVTANAGSIIRDGVDGFLVPTRNVEAIKDKVTLLYHDRHLARSIGEAARRAVEDYTWQRYRERVTDAYARIAQERSGS